MSSSHKAIKLLLALVLAVPLAALSGAHGLSSASLRNAPDLSATVFPINGLALEKVAYRNFVGGVTESLAGPDDTELKSNEPETDVTTQFEAGTLDLQDFAQRASQAAREALMLEPLTAKTHAILALSETDLQDKRRLVALASRLNRRELALQGLVLQQRLDDNDYAGTINTLDQILRVHPERKAEFFPLLVNALAQSATKPAFTSLLSEPLPWRDSFLDAAVGDPRVLENLADIRPRIALDNLAFDQRLIAGLADQGSLASAERMYRFVANPEQSGSQDRAEAWRSAYPPFDWKLADTAEMRAQPSKNLERLELSIEPGNGGILASRILAPPNAPFEIRIGHQIEPASQVKDFRLQLSCWGQSSPFFAEPFAEGKRVFKIDSRPGCEFIELAIIARAWTGSRPLNGFLKPVAISTQ